MADKIPQFNPAPTGIRELDKDLQNLKLIVQLLIEEIKILKAGD